MTQNVAIPEEPMRYVDFLAEITRVFPHAGVLINEEDGQVVVGTYFTYADGMVTPMQLPEWIGTPRALDEPLPAWQQKIKRPL